MASSLLRRFAGKVIPRNRIVKRHRLERLGLGISLRGHVPKDHNLRYVLPISLP
jgi:hypothetical protein